MDNIGNLIKAKRFQVDGSGLRPSRKNTRTYLDNEYFDFGYAALFKHSVTSVYAILSRCANHQTQQCFPSYEYIMKMSGIKNRNQISKALKILEAHNIITINHSEGRNSNNYSMIDPKYWKGKDKLIVENVKKHTVSKTQGEQYHKPIVNSIKDDTRNKLMESANEINNLIGKSSEQVGKELYEKFGWKTR